MIRLPDFYSRLHASGNSETLGLMLACLGLVIYEGPTLLFIVLLLPPQLGNQMVPQTNQPHVSACRRPTILLQHRLSAHEPHIGYIDGRPDMYVDIAISYAILGFICSVIVAKYMGGKDV